MSRRGWFPWALLLSTNVAWGAFALLRDDRDDERPKAGDDEVTELRRENDRLRSALGPPAGLSVSPSPPVPPAAAGEPAKAPSATDVVPAPDPVSVEAWKRSTSWTNDALQVHDLRKREAALSAMRTALSSAEDVDRLAALRAISSIHALSYDKASFRPEVLPLVDATRADERLAAFHALASLGKRPEDLDRVLAHAADPEPEWRSALTRLLVVFGSGDLPGKSEEVVLGLLADPDPKRRLDALRGLTGAALSPTVEERVLAIARSDPRSAYEVTYFVLRNLPRKSEATVDFLMERAQLPAAGDALFALDVGIRPEHAGRVAAFALKIAETRTERTIRAQALRIVEHHADPSLIPEIERFAEAPGLDEPTRADLLEVVGRLRRRAAAPR